MQHMQCYVYRAVVRELMVGILYPKFIKCESCMVKRCWYPGVKKPWWGWCVLAGSADFIMLSIPICLPLFPLLLSPPSPLVWLSQGVPVEFLCCPTSAGVDLDVCSAGHDRQTLHPVSDPLCRVWLTAGFCDCDGALYPEERGRESLELCIRLSLPPSFQPESFFS